MDINIRLVAASLSMMTAACGPVMAAPDGALSAVQAECQQAEHCDALIEFLLATGGDFRADTVKRGLAAAFGSMTKQKAAMVPGFLRDLTAMGLAPDARLLVQDGLSKSVCSSFLSSDQKSDLLQSIVDISGDGAAIGLASGTGGGTAQSCTAILAAYST